MEIIQERALLEIKKKEVDIPSRTCLSHKVKDFDKWKPVFDEHGATRKANGSRGRLFRNADDPNETVIIFECDNLDKARKFARSEDTKKAMQKAGVADKPDVYFLDEVEKVPV